MLEKGDPKSLEERMAACPIHQWTNVDEYLERAQVPQQFRQPLHELVLTRGEQPKYMSDDQGKQFGKQAVEIINRYKIQPIEARVLTMMFGQLVEQWIGSGSQHN